MGFKIVIFLAFSFAISHAQLPRNCGMRSQVSRSRIISGDDTVYGQWPWQVYVYPLDGSDGCGGILITARWVLTAAQCINPSGMYGTYVISGMKTRNATSKEEPFLNYNIIDSWYVYETFDKYTLQDDVALIKLSSSLTLNDYVQPACLTLGPLALGPQGIDEDDLECYISGWGYTTPFGPMSNDLKSSEVNVVNESFCEAQGEEMRPTQSCFKAENYGAGPCNGDFGGPVTCRVKSMSSIYGPWFAHSVMSFASYGGCGRGHSVGSRTADTVNTYYDWIVATLKDN